MLDVGAGSGVLSIAAAKLGAASVMPWRSIRLPSTWPGRMSPPTRLEDRVRVLAGSLERLPGRDGSDQAADGGAGARLRSGAGQHHSQRPRGAGGGAQ